MALLGTDPESYITDFTLVYQDELLQTCSKQDFQKGFSADRPLKQLASFRKILLTTRHPPAKSCLLHVYNSSPPCAATPCEGPRSEWMNGTNAVSPTPCLLHFLPGRVVLSAGG